MLQPFWYKIHFQALMWNKWVPYLQRLWRKRNNQCININRLLFPCRFYTEKGNKYFAIFKAFLFLSDITEKHMLMYSQMSIILVLKKLPVTSIPGIHLGFQWSLMLWRILVKIQHIWTFHVNNSFKEIRKVELNLCDTCKTRQLCG